MSNRNKDRTDQSDLLELLHDTPPAKTLTEVLGLDPVLPGESPEDYRQGLKALIDELVAKSLLQVYLSEKIYDCLWWIRRYEEQKRATIIVRMALVVGSDYLHEMTQDGLNFREAMLNNASTKETYNLAAKKGHSMASLREKAINQAKDSLQKFDQQIALQTKILAGLQASYEVAFNRKRNMERQDLQNAMLRRDLAAIEGETSDQSKTKGRKS